MHGQYACTVKPLYKGHVWEGRGPGPLSIILSHAELEVTNTIMITIITGIEVEILGQGCPRFSTVVTMET